MVDMWRSNFQPIPFRRPLVSSVHEFFHTNLQIKIHLSFSSHNFHNHMCFDNILQSDHSCHMFCKWNSFVSCQHLLFSTLAFNGPFKCDIPVLSMKDTFIEYSSMTRMQAISLSDSRCPLLDSRGPCKKVADKKIIYLEHLWYHCRWVWQKEASFQRGQLSFQRRSKRFFHSTSLWHGKSQRLWH